MNEVSPFSGNAGTMPARTHCELRVSCGTQTRFGGSDMNRVWRSFTYGLFFLILGASRASAQLDTGTIVGTVRDQSGAVVPGATVTATQETTGAAATAVSTDKGQFVFPNLKV